MKILHIIDSAGIYGAEVMLLHLVEEQKKQGINPIIASIGSKGVLEKQLESEAITRGIKIKKIRMASGPNFKGAFDILKYAKKQNINILHTHGYKGNILFGLIPKRLRKLHLVSTCHGWTCTNILSKMKLYQWIDIYALKYADAVVLVNKEMLRNSKLRKLNYLNLYVVQNGIPIAKNNFENQNSTAVPKLDPFIIDFCKKGFIIGSIGRLALEKCYANLIKATDLLIKMGMDIRLVIIGEGPQRNYLENLICQLKLKNRIFLPGYQKSAKDYIPFFDVFVLSSLTEGLPMTLLEAMQVKVPIVAPYVGGVPELLDYGKAGFLAKTCKPEDLANSIIGRHEDNNYANQKAKVAYERVITIYNSSVMASDYLDIYKRLLFKNS